MTNPEFDQFVKSFKGRWPFYQLTPERTAKLYGMFGRLSQTVVDEAMEQYDSKYPDADGRTFKLTDLHGLCLTTQQIAELTWSPGDESDLAHHMAHLRHYGGYTQTSEIEYVLDVMHKPRMPDQYLRGEAARKLKAMGAKSGDEVLRQQELNNRAYDNYRRHQIANGLLAKPKHVKSSTKGESVTAIGGDVAAVQATIPPRAARPVVSKKIA